MSVDIVCSVPHSGTRTLVEHLGIGGNSPRGKWLHFGFEPDRPAIRSGKYHLHIPVCHPMSVAQSWAGRGKNVSALLSAYAGMFEALSQDHTLHKMEDLPRLAGVDDWDRRVHPEAWRVAEYQHQVIQQVVMPHADFFSQFYGDDNAV